MELAEVRKHISRATIIPACTSSVLDRKISKMEALFSDDLK